MTDNKVDPPAVETSVTPASAGRRRVRIWVNWALALSTVVAAVFVVVFAIGAVMSVAACSTPECPDLGPRGFLFNVFLYGAPVVAAATIVASFFTATRRWGVLVPLSGLGLLLADFAALVIAFNI